MAYLDGIDISNWQKGLKIKSVDADFVILKATEGVGYKDSCFDAWAKDVLASGKKLGIYHFATGRTSGAEEAFYFWKVVKKYNGKAIFILDWEANAVRKGVSYAKAFLDNFYKVSGKRCLIYMSQSVTTSYNWSKVAEKYGLWVAGYPNNNTTKYYHPTQYKHLGAWKKAVMRQYSSHGSVKGYGGRLDINCFYGDKEDWDKLAGIKVSEKPKEEPKKEEPKKETPKKEEAKPVQKSIDTIAQEVIAGKWGTGESRNSKLKKAGYDSVKVQNRVNKYYGVAKDAIRGKYGNGSKRTEKLKKAGYSPATVQKIVNELL